MIEWFIGPWGRASVLTMAALAFVSWRAADKLHQQNIGAEKVVAKIGKAQNEKIAKAITARRSVDSIPDERLRDAFFRD